MIKTKNSTPVQFYEGEDYLLGSKLLFVAECKQVYFSCKTGDFKMGDYGEASEGSFEWLLEELQFLAWFRYEALRDVWTFHFIAPWLCQIWSPSTGKPTNFL